MPWNHESRAPYECPGIMNPEHHMNARNHESRAPYECPGIMNPDHYTVSASIKKGGSNS